MNNKQLAEALRAIDMSALPIKDRAAVLNAAEALEMADEKYRHPGLQPTHWMPLPPAPVTAIAAASKGAGHE